jgi:two-component system sensor kinase FixL
MVLSGIWSRFLSVFLKPGSGQVPLKNQNLELANRELEKEMLQRRQAEQELLRIRQAVNSLGDAVVIADTKGRHIFHNPAFSQMFGYSLEEMNRAGGMGFLFLDPKAGRRLMENLGRGLGFAGEVEMRNKEGRRRVIELRADAIKGPEGTILGMVAVQVDVTSHLQAEKALKQSEERFRQVISSISAHIYVTRFGPEGIPENDYLSPNVAALTGYSQEMFVDDWSFWAEQLIQPQDREAARLQAEEFKRGRNSELEYRITKKDGSMIWVRDSGRAERNRETGEITVYGVISDVTQSKYYEEVREALLADVRKVNAELADFAYIVSHDLKAPLRAISSLAGWLAEDYADKIDDHGKEQLQLLLKRTKRMHNLIDGILAYSRLGRIKPVLVEIDSHEAACQVIESLAPPENISIRIEGRLPRVVYDRTHFEQLIQNLCSNALKHLGRPRGQVSISCAELPQSWEYCVRDDGAGIEPRHFDRVFKIFQTLKPRDELESTGIGLTIVKKTAEIYGGSVRLESEPGHGAAFFFTVPKGLKPDPEHS